MLGIQDGGRRESGCTSSASGPVGEVDPPDMRELSLDRFKSWQLLLLQHFVDDELLTFGCADDPAYRRVSGEADLEFVIAGIDK